MSGSIYRNIEVKLTLDDTWAAARMAGMEDDIKNNANGNTYISSEKEPFQEVKDKINDCKSNCHKPRLLFMDETTSTLDNKLKILLQKV
jgi:ATP-binding cassette subfamily C protein